MEKKKSQLPIDLQLYQFRLSGETGYADCIDIAIERLKLLHMIHQMKIDKNELKLEEQLSYLIQLLKSTGDSTFLRLLQSKGHLVDDIMNDRKKDYMSFFFLSWAMCTTDNDLIVQWWYEGELLLFKLRALSLDDRGVYNFVHINKLPYEILCQTEAQLLWLKGSEFYGENLCDTTFFFEVPRTYVRHLVRQRLVLHRGDIALLSAPLLRCELYPYYSDILIVHWADSLAFVESEEAKSETVRKVIEVVKINFGDLPNIDAQLALFKPTDTAENMCCSLSNSNIDEIAINLFPPCMLKIHEKLRKNHHLSYFHRLQLTTFLKNIGMSKENVDFYLRNEFTKKIEDKKFTSEYVYNIKHTYGLVGKMVPYPPRACKFICQDPNNFHDGNGCSFVGDIEDLHLKMKKENIPEKKINTIKKCAANGDYSVACSKYFAAKYNCKEPPPMKYPVNYVKLSIEERNGPSPPPEPSSSTSTSTSTHESSKKL
ncbi:hypothetical protein HCN44_002937 [Aphidius gifuensis]|uniref:DNA primase large subunit C-terminal domain-containing protein n=1 Tax=Aphidius gifuensis TaxID=684658 RepID=A0A834XT19_APHGI|nr:DNA primase large subunit-like [Aphidius gifuensis]KAF7991375.1 hypothetical protein HCN44_002937 [Aphidius gifuensis]